MQTLLFSQRVCRKWRQVITKSTSLQQALFLAPINDYTSFWARDEDGEDDISFTKVTNMTKEQFNNLTAEDDTVQFAMKVNPLLVVDIQGSFSLQCLSDKIKKARPESSCSKMFLTQPPTKCIHVRDMQDFDTLTMYPNDADHVGEKRSRVPGVTGEDAVFMFALAELDWTTLDMQDYQWMFKDGVEVTAKEEKEGYMGISF